MQSRDGVKWVKRKTIYSPSAAGINDNSRYNVRASWPFVVRLNDGRIAVTFTTDELYPSQRIRGSKSKRKFDIVLLFSEGGASFDSLDWDLNSLTRVFDYDNSSLEKNRFPSSLVNTDNELIIFSGLPLRYKRVKIGR